MISKIPATKISTSSTISSGGRSLAKTLLDLLQFSEALDAGNYDAEQCSKNN